MTQVEGWKTRVADALGSDVQRTSEMGGGCVGEVYACALADGREVVAKVDASDVGTLGVEAWMLRYLAKKSALPVPKVYVGENDLLVMERIEGSTGAGGDSAQRHAAELLAALHNVTRDRFGLEKDTLIGGLHQPNGWMDSWIDFFRERRLLAMAKQAQDAGRLPTRAHDRVEACARRLGDLIDEPPAPALVHGDIWSGNVLSAGERITGFIDPAIYYAHPEVELAFITLFATFGRPFFERYDELAGVAPGFFKSRRDVYNLYPLLVHVRLFGGGYVGQLEQTLTRIGF